MATESAGHPTFRAAYWNDPDARQAFKDFILRIHRVDFGAWDRAGYWDDDYRPYSYFVGGQVVASVCIYTMPALVNGQACRVAQVSGVGTLPEYRLRGLNRRLHQVALADALPHHRFVFLHADEEAVPFYRKCGFRPVQAHAPVLRLAPTAPDRDMEQLDVDDPAVRDALYRLACARAPASRAFSTMNPKLVMYHVLYRLRGHVWRIPALDAVALMKRDAIRPVLYDILARELPHLGQLAPYLAADGAREVEIRFSPDQLGAPAGELRELHGENVHVMGAFELGTRPVFPFTSQA